MNVVGLLSPVLVPAIAGLLSLLVPGRTKWMREGIAAAAIVVTLGFASWLLAGQDLSYRTGEVVAGIPYLSLASGHFSSFVMVSAAAITALVIVYSFRYMADIPHARGFYAYALITLGAANGALLAGNLVTFAVFWGIILVMLFLLATIASRGVSPDAAFRSANKSLMILGAADVALIVGLGLLWHACGSFEMDAAIASMAGAEGVAALVLILIGVMAKMGAMPLHSWLPQMSETAPAPVMAFLPASIDKLLGVYILARLVMGAPSLGSGVGLFLMSLGAVTIILSTLMALVQSDMRRLLAYLAISSAGYILLGLGTGTATGTGGALFYLLNTAVWTTCLFLCAGVVEMRTGRTALDGLGGLGRAMPATFAAALVAGLSMSALPPLSGFVAKWMIYQGVLEAGAARYWVFLIVAMFGSALTLASVIKLLHSTFMGERAVGLENAREAPVAMTAPLVMMAGILLLFGIFAQLPLTHFICPVAGEGLCTGFAGTIAGLGVWSPTLATALLLIAVGLGALVYLAGNIRQTRETPVYVGGEVMPVEQTRVPGTRFFDTVVLLRPLSWAYRRAESAAFDVYSYGRPFLSLAEGVKRLHTGRLSLYFVWALLGLVVLALVLVGLR
jgi:formate hydrogenlyase subunit 3/multisubunit Na+/H+ antiporter MnhD subunit